MDRLHRIRAGYDEVRATESAQVSMVLGKKNCARLFRPGVRDIYNCLDGDYNRLNYYWKIFHYVVCDVRIVDRQITYTQTHVQVWHISAQVNLGLNDVRIVDRQITYTQTHVQVWHISAQVNLGLNERELVPAVVKTHRHNDRHWVLIAQLDEIRRFVTYILLKWLLLDVSFKWNVFLGKVKIDWLTNGKWICMICSTNWFVW